MLRRFAFVAAGLLAMLVPLAAHAQKKENSKVLKLPEKHLLHVYLLMGQSNMSGRGMVFKEDRESSARVVALNREGAWVFGAEPLHFDKPAGVAGVGPGLSFARAMLTEASEGVTIALVPCAVAGSALSRWEKGGDLYGETLRRARIAAKDGTLKGILWHQGETDAAQYTLATTYGDRLQQMVKDFRKDLGVQNLPFVAGKVSELIPPNRFPAVRKVNQALAELPKKVPATECAEVNGLTLMADGIHFDTASARTLGKRYASLMLELKRKSR